MYNDEKFNVMSLDEKHEYFMSVFADLRRNGVIKKWKEFATLLDVSVNSISGAKNKNPDYLTASLLVKIDDALSRLSQKSPSVTITNSPNSPVINGDNNQMNVNATPQKVSSLELANQERRYVPTIPIHAYRAVGFDVMKYFAETEEDLHLAPIIMQFPGTDCYYFVNSEDMSPNLRTNDLLCLARLPEGAKVTNGDLCILNTKYQGILERFVYDEGEELVLKSTQPRWTDMRIPKEEIYSIFRILGGIRTNI